MNKRVFIAFISCLLHSAICNANVRFIASLPAPNMRVTYEKLYGEGNYLKMMKLRMMLYKMNRELFNDKVYINLRIGTDSNYYDLDHLHGYRSNYALGYRKLSVPKFIGDSMLYENESRYAIDLHCNTRDINVGDCLKLVAYAAKHIHEIQSKQKLVIANTIFGARFDPSFDTMTIAGVNNRINGYELMPTISTSDIEEILSKDYPEINKYFVEKCFLQQVSHSSGWLGTLSYYTSRDSFYLYKTTANIEPFKEELTQIEQHESEKDTSGKVLYSCSKLYRLRTDGRDNYFVFTSPHWFYHLTVHDGKKYGPYHFARIQELDIYGDVTDYTNVCKVDNEGLGKFVFPVSSWFGDYNVIYNSVTGYSSIDTSFLAKWNHECIQYERTKGRNSLRWILFPYYINNM